MKYSAIVVIWKRKFLVYEQLDMVLVYCEQKRIPTYYDKWFKHSCYHLCKVLIDTYTMATHINIRLRVHSPLPYVFHAFRKIVFLPYIQICISKTATGH